MPTKVYALVFCLAVIVAGCKSSDPPAPANTTGAPGAASPATVANPATSPSTPNAPTAPTVKAKIDTCGLLTSDDVKQVQGEAVKEAQRSDREDSGFIVSQCYYALPTTVNSVVLNVTTAGESGGTTPRTFWKDTFGGKEEKDRGREEKGKRKPGEEEEGDSAPPQKVAGVGEDAYWIASRVGGALYVLKKDVFFRISVGGAADEKSKLKKSKMLAQRVLDRI